MVGRPCFSGRGRPLGYSLLRVGRRRLVGIVVGEAGLDGRGACWGCIECRVLVSANLGCWVGIEVEVVAELGL